MQIVIDKWGPATPQELDAWGAVGQVGYLSLAMNYGKEMTLDAYHALLKDGKGVSFVFEERFDDWRYGYDRGHAYGIAARNHLTNIFGLPADTLVGIAVDDNIFPHDLATAMAHVQGFRDGAGHAWVYGTAFLIDACVRQSFAAFGMQSCSTGYFDNLRVSPNAALHQRCAPDHDTNEVLHVNWGQLPSGTVIPVPRPTPGPSVEKDERMLTVTGIPAADPLHVPFIDINPKDPTEVICFYGAPWPDGPEVTTAFGVSVLKVHGNAVKVAPHPDGVAVRFDNDQCHIAPLREGVTVH